MNQRGMLFNILLNVFESAFCLSANVTLDSSETTKRENKFCFTLKDDDYDVTFTSQSDDY